MTTDYPTRGQQAPVYWDVQLRQWIEEAPLAGGAFAAALLEAVQDILGSSLVGSGATVAYNDSTGQTTITVTGIDAEAARDAIGAALRGTGGINIVVDDSGDTLSVNIADGALTISKTNGLQAALDAKQAQDADLDAIAALTTATFGRSVLTAASLGALLRKSWWNGTTYSPARPADGIYGWEFISTNSASAPAPPTTNLVFGDVWMAHPDAAVA